MAENAQIAESIGPYIGSYVGPKRTTKALAPPHLGITVKAYVEWKELGFTAQQTQALVKVAYEQNRNLIRQKYVGDRFLEALKDTIPEDELTYYAQTPGRFRRFTEMASEIQRARDMLITEDIPVTYRNLADLRDYTPEEIVALTEVIRENTKIQFPVGALAQWAKDADRCGVSLENLVDRRTREGGNNQSDFRPLDNMLGDEEE